MKSQSGTHRLEYLDWLRGIGATIMLHGHVWDSFLRDDLRNRGPYIFSQFLGGMPPAIFLFLTGVTLAFLMDSSERKGMAPVGRVKTAFRRSGYLFFLAFAFRLQLFIFGIPAPWRDLLRVDILNCMGFAIAMLSVLAIFSTKTRAKAAALAGLGIACISPLVSQLHWDVVPWLVRNYIAPDYHSFGFFPWGAYLAFGVSAGSVIRAIPPEATERTMQWTGMLGVGAILVCHYLDSLPYTFYASAEYWLNSPLQILTKTGVVLSMLSAAFVWTRYAAGPGWSWVRQFGTTSLLVYWVHIELVYGRELFFLKGRLNEAQTLVAAVFVILLMLSISVIKTRWTEVRAFLTAAGWWSAPKVERAAGD
ncbi:MAG: acyltransferase family protein [Ignavibacteriota bacterium]